MTGRRIHLGVSLVASLAFLPVPAAGPAWGEEVRYYEQDGVTYRETRRVYQRPLADTQYRETTQTVYREERSVENRETTRTSWLPVTEYRCESYWAGRWNPFIQPYMATRYVPYTRWEQRTEVVTTPATVCRLVPETRTVRVPTTVYRTVPEEVITRVAVSPSASAPSLAGPPVGEPVGGVARLENDPPRDGTSTAWRPAPTATR